MAKQIIPLGPHHVFSQALSRFNLWPVFTGETNGGSLARREQRSDELPACRHS